MNEIQADSNGSSETPATAVDAIEAIEIRLAKAQATAERLRRGSARESYLEAYFLVEALELQLQQALGARRSMRQ